jgi:hypothetical protein
MPAASSFSSGSQLFCERAPIFEWASVHRDFAFSPTRLKTAFKIALECTVCMVLAFSFNWHSAFLAVLLAVLVNRPDIRFDLRQTLWIAGATAGFPKIRFAWVCSWAGG